MCLVVDESKASLCNLPLALGDRPLTIRAPKPYRLSHLRDLAVAILNILLITHVLFDLCSDPPSSRAVLRPLIQRPLSPSQRKIIDSLRIHIHFECVVAWVQHLIPHLIHSR